ncbi:hypothetical protein P22_0344 [Propionispora sp. 2/2-37]|uniref:anaerobic ribonucleoside-triphosphate reductase activating protein n=1 Tax=Propionispora sp. 2/2-37 TaxID=1677858 RepID=UPI0006BB6256|nr:anaerobic ribonucleoside-triphosphate reductase activating protein [Propionispora sp. 2/2-37]CUH94278.1 hypothetical protein P22_0344 [Propionispora sp. 2/2-37]
MIRYADIISESIVDGLGIRVAAFLQGCPRACRGCHNQELLPTEGGMAIEEEEFADLLLSKITPLHQGITFTGGDPLLQHETLCKVITLIRKKNPDLDIWVYTGYTFEEIRHLEIVRNIDVLVDGPFILEEKDIGLPLRGSKNQRIIDIAKTLQQGTMVTLDVDHSLYAAS